MELDGRDSAGYFALGLAYWIVSRDYDAAIRSLEEALRIISIIFAMACARPVWLNIKFP